MSIVLIRHGETPLNAARVIQPADTPLSERGRAQAEAVARRLAARAGPAAILSSDLLRAFETATAIAAATGLDLRATELLQERNFGALRGRAYDDLGFDPLATTDAPPGGESVAEFEARVARAFGEILAVRAALAGDLVVVTHGLVIRTLLTRHARLAAGLEMPASLANTSVTVLAPVAPHDTLLVNCTVHLQGSARDEGRGLSGF
jgi:probable phosphoglycerate mutase